MRFAYRTFKDIGLSMVIIPEDHVTCHYSEQSKNELPEQSRFGHRGHPGQRRKEVQHVHGKVTRSKAYKL